MKLFNLAALLIAFSCCSCQDGDESPNYRENPTFANEVSVPDSARVGVSFPVDLVVFGSDGCSEFARFSTSTIQDTTIVSLYQRRDLNESCTTATIQFPATIELSFTSPGMKYLIFNEGTTDELRDSIRVVE